MEDEPTYTKYLIARHSPENHCHVPDGMALSLIAKPMDAGKMKRDKQHHFVSAGDGKTRSQYGWVRETTPFTIEEFITQHITPTRRAPSVEEREGLRILFSSISRLDTDTPVTTDYSIRGVIERQAVLAVHKVIFYYPVDGKK